MDFSQSHWPQCLIVLLIVFTFSRISGQDSWPPPPPWADKASVARYLVHYASWGIVAARSPDYDGSPFGTLQSFADGPIKNSTGTPYFYIATISDTWKNAKFSGNVSFTLSQAESDYCAKKKWDPEEPLCSRVTLLGQILALTDPVEESFAKKALFSRHPAMSGWPHDHDWIFCKLGLTHISLLDFYGGATKVSLADYYAAKP